MVISSQNKISKRPINTQQSAYQSSRKCKLKLQWDIFLYPLEWLPKAPKTLITLNIGKVLGQLKLSYFTGRNAKWSTILENSLVVYYEVKYILPYDPAVLILGIQKRNENTNQQKTFIKMFIATLFIITRNWQKLKCLLTCKRRKQKWYNHTIEYYTAMKKRQLLYVATWLNRKKTLYQAKAARHGRVHTQLMWSSKSGKVKLTEVGEVRRRVRWTGKGLGGTSWGDRNGFSLVSGGSVFIDV